MNISDTLYIECYRRIRRIRCFSPFSPFSPLHPLSSLSPFSPLSNATTVADALLLVPNRFNRIKNLVIVSLTPCRRRDGKNWKATKHESLLKCSKTTLAPEVSAFVSSDDSFRLSLSQLFSNPFAKPRDGWRLGLSPLLAAWCRRGGRRRPPKVV